jgi:hypothetical protein
VRALRRLLLAHPRHRSSFREGFRFCEDLMA